jgi:hypothetical protein
MGAEDAFQYYSCIWPGKVPGVGFVDWFDMLARSIRTRTGMGISGGAMHQFLLPQSRGDTIAIHENPS